MKCVHEAMPALCHVVVSEDPPAMGSLGTLVFHSGRWEGWKQTGKVRLQVGEAVC